MPIPVARDPEVTHKALQRWFDEGDRGLSEVKVDGEFTMPQGAGNSNETLLFSVEHGEGQDRRREELVLRIEASSYSLFMDASLLEQCEFLRQLESFVSFPVPEVRWIEADGGYLGAPFCMMTRAQGRVPPDNAVGVGWPTELPPDQQHRLWENAISTFCSIHTDAGRHRVEDVLAPRLHGRTGIVEQLDYWDRYPEWAGVDDDRLRRVSRWIHGHVPRLTDTALSWGDARMENMIFDDGLDCTAVLDWEMVSLGGPLLDLAWWLVFDRFIAETSRPEGYGTRQETIAAWEFLTNISVRDLAWYETFCAFRLGAICGRIHRLSESMGVDMGGVDLVGSCMDLADQYMG